MTVLSAPSFLVGVPSRVSSFFCWSVILLIEHDSKGSMGLVLNRPTDHTVAELNEVLTRSRRRQDRVFLGGPVELSYGFILHDEHYRGPDTKPIADGLGLSMTLESIKVISEDETLPFRCFIGYAGWGPSQLESELAEEKWLHCPVLPDLVFSPEPDKLWDTVLKNIGIDPVSVLVGDTGIE